MMCICLKIPVFWDVILSHLVVINILDMLYGLEMSALPVSMVQYASETWIVRLIHITHGMQV